MGIGNILVGDEGIGVRVIEAFQARFDLPPSLEVIDGGTMGLDLLSFIEGRERLLLVDAVNIDAQPGTIVTLEGEDVPKFLSIKMSVHQIGLPEMLSAARMIGILPKELCLVGIQPKTLDTGLDLSDEVSGKMDELLSAITDKLGQWGIELQERAGVC